MKLTQRSITWSLFLMTLLLLGASLLLQFVFNLIPCSLCMIDRIIVFFLAILFFVALLHHSNQLAQKIYSAIGLCLAVFGIFVTARHLWILQLPPENLPACSPGFHYLIRTLPLKEAIILMLEGSGECADNSTFAGFSLPLWAMLGFIMLAIGNLLVLFLKDKKKG